MIHSTRNVLFRFALGAFRSLDFFLRRTLSAHRHVSCWLNFRCIRLAAARGIVGRVVVFSTSNLQAAYSSACVLEVVRRCVSSYCCCWWWSNRSATLVLVLVLERTWRCWQAPHEVLAFFLSENKKVILIDAKRQRLLQVWFLHDAPTNTKSGEIIILGLETKFMIVVSRNQLPRSSCPVGIVDLRHHLLWDQRKYSQSWYG
jgi:hypothetical protein